MARKKAPEGEPTKAEMEILHLLWAHGPSTVRFINEELNKQSPVAYTTTLKFMQLMHEKGFVFRDSTAMTHIYMPAIKEAPTKKAILKRFVDAVYKGSSSELILQLLGDKKPKKEELESLREILKKYDKK